MPELRPSSGSSPRHDARPDPAAGGPPGGAPATADADGLTLTVSLAERSYPIQIGSGLLDDNPALLALAQGRQVAVITNETVAPLYAPALVRSLARAAAVVETITLPDGEAHKSWTTLNRIFDVLLDKRFDRRCLLVALGGGVIGDMAGFAAAVYQRGVDFVQVPTTLLAQVDSSVGGKTAINHPAGKNMIGAFHQPRLVIADVATLATLPPRELPAGLAEVVKHGFIADVGYLDQVEADLPALLAQDAAALTRAVAGSCRIKAGVVAQDEREGGLRAILNFGHTFGHAIEAGLGYGQWLHGEAVGCGMVMAADLSRRLGWLPDDEAARVRDVVRAARLPVTGPGWTPERYLSLMEVDKKAEQGTPKFVLLERLGRPRVSRVDEAPLFETLRATTEQADARPAGATGQ